MPSTTGNAPLRGRRRERETLDQVLRDVRSGRSRVLVLRGEAGAGKTALLDYLSAQAPAGRVTRTAGVEPESEIAYSALQQLCAPLLEHLGGLPEPQRDALGTAFGLAAGRPPEALVVGLAVLGLLAEAAAEQPLVAVVDDVQWMDRMSEVILTFVARRLEAESVALVFAARGPFLEGLPELRVEGLPAADARALLDSVLSGPVDDRVRDRIVAETRGNPLALLELPRGLTPAELTFGFGAPGAATLAGRVEEGFQRRIAALPADARRALLTAAVEPVGDVTLLWQALEQLGLDPGAAAPAEAAGLVEFGTRVRFRHPLVRSAARRAADAAELREAHRALAAATDPGQDPDRRAWHHAHAATGPDEEVAGELERSADRALARGGRAAAAAFLERAAELTSDPKRRGARIVAAAAARLAAGEAARVPDLLAAAELGPLDPARRAEAERLRARAAFAVDDGGGTAGPQLLAAARRLEELDPRAARETYLVALGAAVGAGRRGDEPGRTAAAARSAPVGEEPAALLLTGLTAWVLDGYAPAVPLLGRALAALADDPDPDLLWLAAPVAYELWDDAVLDALTEHAAGAARAAGALSVLPAALAFRAGAELHAGRFAAAAGLLAEAGALGQATGLAPPASTALVLAAYRGAERPALDLIDAAGPGAAGWAHYAKAVLHNGLGNAQTALAAARTAAAHEELAVSGPALAELVEAAVHTGDHATAGQARERLAERTGAARTGWALGTRAVADALAGPPQKTEDRYREALDRLDNGRLGLHLARARLLYGEWLRREQRRGEARDQLRAAHEALAGMGAEGYAARAGRELAATGETVRSRSPAAREEFTPQEAQIARLAVAGRTNPEIGAALFLSPRTVEWHLRKVFSKLGISSRRELPAALRDR